MGHYCRPLAPGEKPGPERKFKAGVRYAVFEDLSNADETFLRILKDLDNIKRRARRLELKARKMWMEAV